MRPSFRILFLALPLLATGCGSLFYVEAETEEVCRTEHNVTFPGSIPIPGTVSQEIHFPVGDITGTIPRGSTEAQLRVHLFEVTATSGNPELSGVERASVSIRLPSDPTPTVLLEYRRPANQTSTQKLSAAGSGTLDLNQLLEQDQLVLNVTASGTLPTREWKADVRVCAGLWLRTDVLDLLF